MNTKFIITRNAGILAATALGAFAVSGSMASPADKPSDADNFYKSGRISQQEVKFNNQYRMKVAGNLFLPKDMDKEARCPAIIVGHPMGAVKEQSANLYAAKMAERGFVTLALDLPFWGGSDGEPRNSVSPDMYAEAFSAAADYLGTRPFVDRDRIGVIGICGSGSFAISAAKIDPRLKAIATVSMYDMGAASGTVHELREDSSPIEREFFEFYRTPRGEFTPEGQSPELTTHPTLASNVKFMNFYPFSDIETISPRALLFITGEEAHSREFSEDAYKRAAEPKELYRAPRAGHVDLYDRVNMIPFDKLTDFFSKNLK